jgi:internalin A
MVSGNIISCIGVIIQLFNGYFMWYIALPLILVGIVLSILAAILKVKQASQNQNEKGKRIFPRILSSYLVSIVIAGIVALGLYAFYPAGNGSPVYFADKNFEHVIRESLDKRLGDITNIDMLTVSAVNGCERGIYNIEPLVYCKNVYEINLEDNYISDISVLSSLDSLEELYLGSNYFIDISSLSNLINLRQLDLGYNQQITDISSLSRLVNLNSLDLECNKISDISPLHNLVNLSDLYLNENDITDIKPLSSLINLKYLYLSGNQIIDYSPISLIYNQLESTDISKP